MTAWTPDWAVSVNGAGDVTNVTLANLTITSGRTDIYSQPYAGYCNIELINNDQSAINIDVNDAVIIKVKDSTGTYVNLFGGDVTDIDVEVRSAGSNGIQETVKITALGALSKLPKILTDGVLSKDFDGNQIYTILSALLFGQWNAVPPALTWAAYDPTTTWANAENTGLGEIDQPGDYELAARSSSATDVYSLVSGLATSGVGYLYEDASGRIGYADSTHRSQYLAANGYVEVTGNHALANGIRTSKRIGDLRNKVTVQTYNDTQQTATDAASVALYGEQAQIIETTLHNSADATTQAAFYLSLRAYPQDQFRAITFPLTNPEIDNGDRDKLLNVFMGQPLDITDLPANMVDGRFQGFVEGWTFSAGYNRLDLTLVLSPIAYSLQAMKWENVPATEAWNTISTTLDWLNATIVA
jgi:hypothetical protein